MTLSKKKLKNMFLLKLEEFREPGSGHSYGADSIIPSLNRGKISEDEKILAWEGFDELKREGLIMQDPKQQHSHVFTRFTEEGTRYLEKLKAKGDLEIEEYKISFEELISDEKLKEVCRTAFDNGEYWDSVNNAMRHLEVRIRDKCGFPPVLCGMKLISAAFEEKGKLKNKLAQTEEEEKGFHLLLMGLIKFHRNASAHREGVDERNNALKIISYVDYLINIIETFCETKEN